MLKLPLKNRGFTFVEIMIMVAILLILLAIVLPNFLRAIHNANEFLAVKGLRVLSDALEMYKNDYGDYPPDVVTGLLNCYPPYISNRDIVEATTPRQGSTGSPYNGYYFDYSKRSAPSFGYYYTAQPAVSGRTGTKSFYVDESAQVKEGSPLPPSPPPPPPPPSCPYLYVWDGYDYVKDNDILPMADISNLGEYIDYYLLSKIPVIKDDRYLLKIIEEMPEVSYLDKLSLIMIDHPLETQIAPDPQGNIWTIQNPISPISSIDNKGRDVLPQIKNRGDDFCEINQNSWTIINFGQVKSENGARIIISVDPRPASVHIQILDSANKWQDVSVIHPHEFWDIWAVDLAKFLSKEDGDFKIRLYCTATHKIDYVALDISKQQPITKTELPMMNINSSLVSENLKNILSSDNQYVTMNKGDYLELEFPSYSQTKVKRDFILISEGYYVPQMNEKETNAQ